MGLARMNPGLFGRSESFEEDWVRKDGKDDCSTIKRVFLTHTQKVLLICWPKVGKGTAIRVVWIPSGLELDGRMVVHLIYWISKNDVVFKN
jgi:hypothetical protein